MLKKHTKVELAEANLDIPAGGKKYKGSVPLAASHPSLSILLRLKDHLARWNECVGSMKSLLTLSENGSLNSIIHKHSRDAAEALAHIAVEMEALASLPNMVALLGSMAECKKMEIRRGCMTVTELVEENTHKRLHTQLFFQALDSQTSGRIGYGLDLYKDIMDEMVRRLSLFARMGFLEEAAMDECIHELKNCSEMFHKKRDSILEKAGVPKQLAEQFAFLIDGAMLLPKHMPKMNQISLATFDSDASVKLAAANLAAFYDEIACGNVDVFTHIYRQKRRELN